MESILEIGIQNALMATVLACLVAALARVVRRPAVRHCLWLLVLLKLITPPLWDWPIVWTPAPLIHRETALPTLAADSSANAAPHDATRSGSLPEALTAPEELATLSGDPVATQPETRASVPSMSFDAPEAELRILREVNWKTALFSIWAFGAACFLVVAAYRLWRFRRLLDRARLADDEVRQRVSRLGALLGMRRLPTVRLAAWAVAPVMIALGRRPCLLIPESLWVRLGNAQRDTLLTHELAHLHRGDHWVRWLELLTFVLYFWHPVLWWARRRLRDAEEECCDAWVIATLPAARDAYASALVETVSFLSERRGALPLLASGAAHVRFLERRLTMIMQGNPRARLSWLGVAALLILGVALPLRPTLAQPAAPPAGQSAPISEPSPPRDALASPRIYTSYPVQNRSITESSQDLSDDVELLRVQLTAKQAETLEAKALLEQSRRQVDRLTRARAGGAIAEEEVDQAKTELQVREARLQVKEAQAKEAALRLTQAERRLGSLRQRGSSEPAKPSPNVPYGPPMSGSPPISTSLAPKASPASDPAPTKTASYPAHPLRSIAGQSNDDRLSALEKKIDVLTNELAALRQQLSPRTDPTLNKK